MDTRGRRAAGGERLSIKTSERKLELKYLVLKLNHKVSVRALIEELIPLESLGQDSTYEWRELAEILLNAERQGGAPE